MQLNSVTPSWPATFPGMRTSESPKDLGMDSETDDPSWVDHSNRLDEASTTTQYLSIVKSNVTTLKISSTVGRLSSTHSITRTLMGKILPTRTTPSVHGILYAGRNVTSSGISADHIDDTGYHTPHNIPSVTPTQHISDGLYHPNPNRTSVSENIIKISAESVSINNILYKSFPFTQPPQTRPHMPKHPVPPIYTREHSLMGHETLATTGSDADVSKQEAGPYFLPPGAMSKSHRTKEKSEFSGDPGCFPGCKNYTTVRENTESKQRTRKHSIKENKNFVRNKFLHESMHRHADSPHQATEFYAWIFGATMLTLGSITTVASCLVFFLCSEKWKERRRRKLRFDKSGEYERVDSVSSMVDSQPSEYDLSLLDTPDVTDVTMI